MGSAGHVEVGARITSPQMQPFVIERRIDVDPSFRAMHLEEAGHVRAVGGVAGGEDAGGKPRGPGEVLFNLVETAVVVNDGAECSKTLGLLAGEVARRVQR